MSHFWNLGLMTSIFHSLLRGKNFAFVSFKLVFLSARVVNCEPCWWISWICIRLRPDIESSRIIFPRHYLNTDDDAKTTRECDELYIEIEHLSGDSTDAKPIISKRGENVLRVALLLFPLIAHFPRYFPWLTSQKKRERMSTISKLTRRKRKSTPHDQFASSFDRPKYCGIKPREERKKIVRKKRKISKFNIINLFFGACFAVLIIHLVDLESDFLFESNWIIFSAIGKPRSDRRATTTSIIKTGFANKFSSND